MARDLLTSKTAPPAKLLSALLIGCLIVGIFYLSLHHGVHGVTEYFHDHQGKMTRRVVLVLPLIAMCVPLGTVLFFALLIPLGVYIFDHAAFQSLNVLRPDHYLTVVARVWRTWSGAKNGKLNGKDL